MSSDSAAPRPDRAFSYRSYRFYWAATALASFAAQIMAIAVGLDVFLLTHDAGYLGLIGLSLFSPSLLLVLVTGLAADRFNRRLIMVICGSVEFVVAIILLIYSAVGATSAWPVFALLIGLGTSRAFLNPAGTSLAPNLVPPEALASAVSLNASAWQAANIVGPIVGGVLASISIQLAFGTAAAFSIAAVTCVAMIKAPAQKSSSQATSIDTLLAGFRYIWHEKIVLGAISLDLFAVLLAGTTSLLPVYARDVLHVGSAGLGHLAAAPGVGAAVTALWFSFRPLRYNVGPKMLASVGIFGLATIVFGATAFLPQQTAILVALAAMATWGSADMFSVFVRQSLIQLHTPDTMRGRVSSVSMMTISASNELGEAESGFVAALIGPVAAVIVGGVGAIVVTLTWLKLFPELRLAKNFDPPEHLDIQSTQGEKR